ncbi:MAG: efflux RND transporter periplasmic adaptor subunit [Chloroflexota bacterium]
MLNVSRWPRLVALLLTTGLLAGCVADHRPVAPTAVAPATAVGLASAAKGSIEATLAYPGNIQTRAQVPIVPEVAGRIKSLAVDIGSEVKAGDPIAELDSAAYELQVAQAQAALAAADARLKAMEAGARGEQVALVQANYTAAQERLAGMREGGRSEMAAQAEANYQAALARLEQARKGATPEQIAQAEANVRLARNNLAAQQKQGDALKRVLGALPGDPSDEGLREAQVGIAYEQVQAAEAKLAEVKAGASPEQITQLEMAVEAARQQMLLAQNPYTAHDLAQAEAAATAARQQVALAQTPFTANEINAARAGVAQAQAAVDLARLQRQKAAIVAPVDGVVAQRLASVGAMVGPTGPIVVLVAREVEVTVNVEEARLGRIKVGQLVALTVAAYPGESFRASVAAIAPTVDARSRLVVVKIRPQPDSRLLDGMFAQVSITTGELSGALLVPASAVLDRDGRKIAFVFQEGAARLREVKTGLSSAGKVEIVEGLAEGEQVVVEGADSLSNGQPISPKQ